ncbi:hypothetical protein Tco_0877021 [Tanacetum coccineum]|uniref:Uncharacterized protein n=1 Tax=Tanacetum coccineum TaxID=301880 RepID=A0ABQ5BTX4_9ASTR
MEPDIENITLDEYLEYKAKKERQLRRNVRSKRSTIKYERVDFDSFYRDKSRDFDYPHCHEEVEIKSDEVDINSMTIAEYELYIANFEDVFGDLFEMGAENLRGTKQKEARWKIVMKVVRQEEPDKEIPTQVPIVNDDLI